MVKPTLQVSLSVAFLREGRQFVAYSPALDLSTAGATLEESKKRFAEAAQIFLEETSSMGTLSEVLGELGWKQSNHRWDPPTIVAQSSELVKIPLPA